MAVHGPGLATAVRASSLDTAVVVMRPKADSCSVSSMAAPRPPWSSAEPAADTDYSIDRYREYDDRYDALRGTGNSRTYMLPFSAEALTRDELWVEDFTNPTPAELPGALRKCDPFGPDADAIPTPYVPSSPFHFHPPATVVRGIDTPPLTSNCSTLSDSADLASTTSDSSTETTEDQPGRHLSAIIRHAFARDPKYAEQIISAVRQLPDSDRGILLEFEHILETARSGVLQDSLDTPSEQDTPSKQDTPSEQDTPSKQTSQSSAGATSQGGRTQSTFGSSSRGSRNRPELPNGNGQNNGNGGPGEPNDPPAKEWKKDDKWACPCYKAFPTLTDNAIFASCRPPGYWKEPSAFKGHLRRVHSPEAPRRDSDPENAKFYMNEEQWALVQAALNMEARPRDPALKFQARMDCYLKIWRIMFPARLYPDLVEPTSPCHTDGAVIASPPQRVRVMHGDIRSGRANIPAQDGSTAPGGDYRPSEAADTGYRYVAIIAGPPHDISEGRLAIDPEMLRADMEDRIMESVSAQSLPLINTPLSQRETLASSVSPAADGVPTDLRFQPGAAPDPSFEFVGRYTLADAHLIMAYAQGLIRRFPNPNTPQPELILHVRLPPTSTPPAAPWGPMTTGNATPDFSSPDAAITTDASSYNDFSIPIFFHMDLIQQAGSRAQDPMIPQGGLPTPEVVPRTLEPSGDPEDSFMDLT